MQIKTISTVAGVNEIDFGNDSSQSTAHFYWFKNLGNSTLYVSAKPNPVAGEDNVAELSVNGAASIETDEGKVYVLGSGKVEIHRTNSKFCPFELPSTGSDGGGGGSITVDSELSDTSTNPLQNKVTTAAINDVKTRLGDIPNPNLLINPDFKINQREFKGIQYPSDSIRIYYTVDRWAVQPGQGMIVNSDGTVTIYGGCIQKIEKDVGDNVTASVGVVSGSAMANYNPQTKTFSITTDGKSAVISWAKLEIGSAATPFSPPELATELLKCQRYYQVHNLARQRIWYYTANMLAFFLPNKVLMRSDCSATINGTLAIFTLDNKNQSGFNFVIEWAIADGVKVCAEKTAHGLTDAVLYVNGLPSNGRIEIDAEIY